MQPAEITKQVQFDHFDELRCAFLCTVILKPSTDNKQTLVIPEYNQNDLYNFQITIKGRFPPKRRSICTLFLSKSHQQDSVLTIVAYLKDATIISFAPIQFDLLACCIKTSDHADEIPKNIRLKILPSSKIYGEIQATENIKITLKPESIVRKLTMHADTIKVVAQKKSQVTGFIIASASSELKVTAETMVKIENLKVITPTLTTKAEGPDTELIMTGSVDNHTCSINNRVKYNCKDLITGKNNVSIQKYCLAEFCTQNPINGTKHDEATIQNFGRGKINVTTLPITPPDQ